MEVGSNCETEDDVDDVEEAIGGVIHNVNDDRRRRSELEITLASLIR